ncbi:unnamed protein product, partial [Echinostoma caproni]|uniref:Peptidase A2 domain-containing protein n=1 Tax=Echinostoma caproni TaxID=27848 RepID=A0A183A139_9TREM
MRQLLGTRVLDDAILRQLWLKRLPPRIREVLAVLSNSSLDEMALAADKICSNWFFTSPAHGHQAAVEVEVARLHKPIEITCQPAPTLNIAGTTNNLAQSQEMHPTLFVHLTGKPQSRTVMTALVSGILPSRLLFIQDQSTGIRFLIDTGAELSVIPR